MASSKILGEEKVTDADEGDGDGGERDGDKNGG